MILAPSLSSFSHIKWLISDPLLWTVNIVKCWPAWAKLILFSNFCFTINDIFNWQIVVPNEIMKNVVLESNCCHQSTNSRPWAQHTNVWSWVQRPLGYPGTPHIQLTFNKSRWLYSSLGNLAFVATALPLHCTFLSQTLINRRTSSRTDSTSFILTYPTLLPIASRQSSQSINFINVWENFEK